MPKCELHDEFKEHIEGSIERNEKGIQMLQRWFVRFLVAMVLLMSGQVLLTWKNGNYTDALASKTAAKVIAELRK